MDVSGYHEAVIRLLAKLVLLFAVLLMPVGMSGAAAAQGTAHDAPHAMMPMGHCPDGSPAHHEKGGGIAECTMACAGALPAVEPARHRAVLAGQEVIQPIIVRQLHGLHPETATPPPKTS
jgi:hypothetical protein